MEAPHVLEVAVFTSDVIHVRHTNNRRITSHDLMISEDPCVVVRTLMALLKPVVVSVVVVFIKIENGSVTTLHVGRITLSIAAGDCDVFGIDIPVDVSPAVLDVAASFSWRLKEAHTL